MEAHNSHEIGDSAMPSQHDSLPVARQGLAALESALREFNRFYVDADAELTAPDVLAELNYYLGNMDKFSPLPETALNSLERLRWFSEKLGKASIESGCDTFSGVLSGLKELAGYLEETKDVQASASVAARLLLRLEVELASE